MDNKNIIIILLIIIIILLASIIGVIFLQHNTKDSTKIKINKKNLYEGSSLSVQLTDSNKTALSSQKVHIKITDKNNKVVVNESIKTNSKGKAKLKLNLTKGKYKVKVIYRGNDNFTGCNTTQNLTIKEKVVESQEDSSNSYDESYSQKTDWIDSDGEHHYYENGVEYVGTRDGQHMDIETHNYVKEHGMP